MMIRLVVRVVDEIGALTRRRRHGSQELLALLLFGLLLAALDRRQLDHVRVDLVGEQLVDEPRVEVLYVLFDTLFKVDLLENLFVLFFENQQSKIKHKFIYYIRSELIS